MVKVPRPYRIGGVVVAVLMAGIGFLPLFGGPGYEQALASGLVTPSAAAIATALDVSKPREEGASLLPSVGRGVLAGLAYAGISLLTALLHALRVGLCDLWGTLLYFLLTAGAGSVMGGAWGAFAGEWIGVLAKRRRVLFCVLAALAAPIGGILLSLLRFYTSPMIFAFDPFVGYFSGTLYDTVIDAGTPILTYRLGSVATLVSLSLAASVMSRYGRRWRVRLDWRALLAAAAGAASLAVFLAGAALGHMSTPASIAKDLGAEKHGKRCDVVYPSTTREEEANLLVKDCEEQLAMVEKRLGARGPSRVRAWFFRDADDKKRLMGAAHTYVAKPWREEVYLQLGGYPHPVLGHELGHVVAGSFGRGPFRIAGSAGGWIPNPGLIEGVAVFASPDDEDLTDPQWARAMLHIGILPPMEHVFSFGFLGDASSKSYTLAGAFVDFLGIDTTRKWYAGGDIVTLTGKDWPTLDREFREWVEKVPLPPEAESFARAKFARPGIFGRKCPHVVDAIRREADTCESTQRYAEAIEKYQKALSKDPADWQSSVARARTMRRHGEDAEERAAGRENLEALARDEKVPRVFRDRAEEALADAELIDGAYESAARRYDALAAASLDEDTARTLEVKALAARDESARPAILALLIGDELHGPDIYVGGVELGKWECTASSLAEYLIGRNMVNRGFFERGAVALDAALDDVLPTPRIARETLRQRAIAACALGDKEALARVVRRIESPDDPFKGASGGRRESTLRMIDRCGR